MTKAQTLALVMCPTNQPLQCWTTAKRLEKWYYNAMWAQRGLSREVRGIKLQRLSCPQAQQAVIVLPWLMQLCTLVLKYPSPIYSDTATVWVKRYEQEVSASQPLILWNQTLIFWGHWTATYFCRPASRFVGSACEASLSFFNLFNTVFNLEALV